MQENCSNRSILIDNFCPVEQYERDHFNAALKMHALAVEADDLDIARENRRFLERFRADKCYYCRSQEHHAFDTDTNDTIGGSDTSTRPVVSSESPSSATEESQPQQVHAFETSTTERQDNLSSS